ncbi:VOC family protein [Adhaeribacter radiodurans]|uniref:VOC family protein n=1 Tax=Adhaeribacter radiodurans TaxID=2745197 RepID=A0A7L7L6G9_9BACT|nr:VOC family protein [Adhaeribacter radiodurans]QMU27959.1 VOC family protein [Adhaeribacter radiodurans]
MEFIKIKETCLYVTDLEQSKAFYHNKLGLPIISEVPGRHLFLRVGSSVLLLFIAEVSRQSTEVPPHFGSGHLHIAFETSPEEYLKWKEKINEQQISIEHEHNWGNGYLSFYFRDPDQHCLEIVITGMWEKP